MRVWPYILFGLISLLVRAEESEPAFRPTISVEKAALTARRALEKNKFNSKRFEIRSIKYKPEIILAQDRKKSKGDLSDPHLTQLKKLQKQFGVGPAWEVSFWRTKKVSNTGIWYDGINFGLTVFVFQDNQAAVLDRRIVKSPDDKIPPTEGHNKAR